MYDEAEVCATAHRHTQAHRCTQEQKIHTGTEEQKGARSHRHVQQGLVRGLKDEGPYKMRGLTRVLLGCTPG